MTDSSNDHPSIWKGTLHGLVIAGISGGVVAVRAGRGVIGGLVGGVVGGTTGVLLVLAYNLLRRTYERLRPPRPSN